MAKRPSNADLTDQVLAMVREKINDAGWAVQGIFPTAENPGLQWQYTIGLWERFGHPELVMFGLPARHGQTILNMLGNRVKAGEDLEPGRRYMDVLAGVNGDMPCEFVKVPHAFTTRRYDYFNVARAFYRGTMGWTVMQLVWPDPERRFPWEDGFDVARYGEAQPVLSQAALDAQG